MLRVVQDLDAVVPAGVGHGRDLEHAVAHKDDRRGLFVQPLAAVRKQKAGLLPLRVRFEDAVVIADDDFGGG